VKSFHESPTISAEFLNMSDPSDRLAVALDVPDAPSALELAERLQGSCRWLKVGMELYYATGNSLIEELRGRGFRIFLDLKLHDIPNTVAGAVRSVSNLGAELLTVHASGGPAMLRAATEAAQAPGAPRLLAVTVLTSMDAGELTAVGVQSSPAGQALQLARTAIDSGLSGLVCSAEEVTSLRAEAGADAILVVPGIRPAGSAKGDQRRVATPGEAIAYGASLLVVGRPITQASDPAQATQSILKEIEGAIQPPR
jgi:orotidine-5'-phosphate decarboxylase